MSNTVNRAEVLPLVVAALKASSLKPVWYVDNEMQYQDAAHKVLTELLDAGALLLEGEVEGE
ncbi:MAG TPA: hypothetical protein VMW79_10830 [Anaerolineae bacterium]|nr:hypothetical protein [Anaerolineae bacterium]